MDATNEGASVKEAAMALLADEKAAEERQAEPTEESPIEESSETEVELSEVETTEDSSEDAAEEDAESGEEIDLDELRALIKDNDIPLTVKVDGNETEVPLSDILKSYQSYQSVNNRSMQLAEERKVFEAESQQKLASLDERVTQMDQGLQMVGAMLTAKWNNVDWQTLQTEDPTAYLTKRQEYADDVAHIRGQYEQLNAGQEVLKAEQEKARAEALQREQEKVLEVFPEWSDESVRSGDVKRITNYLQGVGFSDEEIASVADHRMLRILMDATKGVEVKEKAPVIKKRVVKAPKKVIPGKAEKSAGKELESLRKRANDGDFKAAVELQKRYDRALQEKRRT